MLSYNGSTKQHLSSILGPYNLLWAMYQKDFMGITLFALFFFFFFLGMGRGTEEMVALPFVDMIMEFSIYSNAKK